MEKDYMNPHVPENQRAEEQNADRLAGGYGAKYYDENQDKAGEVYDLATGEPIKNDQNMKTSHGFITPEASDKLLKKELAADPNTAWLLANGFDENGNEIDKAA